MKTSMIAIFMLTTSLFTYGEDIKQNDDRLNESIHSSVNDPHNLLSRCEIVMVEGMWIEFKNSNGDMKITAGKGLERSYTWAGNTRSLVMLPRTERWHGSLGLYAYIKGENKLWEEHDGVKRYIAEEGQRHFTDTTAAIEWLRKRSKLTLLDHVYNNTGLVVGMVKLPRSLEERKKQVDIPGILLIEVWQIYINGKKPQKLEGAKDEAITVSYPLNYNLDGVEPPQESINNQ